MSQPLDIKKNTTAIEHQNNFEVTRTDRGCQQVIEQEPPTRGKQLTHRPSEEKFRWLHKTLIATYRQDEFAEATLNIQ